MFLIILALIQICLDTKHKKLLLTEKTGCYYFIIIIIFESALYIFKIESIVVKNFEI